MVLSVDMWGSHTHNTADWQDWDSVIADKHSLHNKNNKKKPKECSEV